MYSFPGPLTGWSAFAKKKQPKFVPFSIDDFDEPLAIQVLKSKLLGMNDSLIVSRACIPGNFQGTTEQTVICIEKTEHPFLTGTLDLPNFDHIRIRQH